jgi:hypothetical protein
MVSFLSDDQQLVDQDELDEQQDRDQCAFAVHVRLPSLLVSGGTREAALAAAFDSPLKARPEAWEMR